MDVFEIIIALIGILGGSGGVFAFINAHHQNKIQDRNSSAEEWQELYKEMKERLDQQEATNRNLKQEITELKNQIRALTTELETYKKYDNYITSLEMYVKSVLNAMKPLVTADVYKSLCDKRPRRDINNNES